jgi:hypothetical protein
VIKSLPHITATGEYDLDLVQVKSIYGTVVLYEDSPDDSGITLPEDTFSVFVDGRCLESDEWTPLINFVGGLQRHQPTPLLPFMRVRLEEMGAQTGFTFRLIVPSNSGV